MIRQDGVDILVDLTQHLAGNRLLESEMGVGSWEIGWKREPELRSSICPPGTADFSPSLESDLRLERVFLLDRFWCYDPHGLKVDVNELPARKSGRVSFGSLSHFGKVNEKVLKLWARILGAMLDSRLVLLTGAGQHRQRTLDLMGREGIAPHRLEFLAPVARPAYMELYHRLDIGLDPFPYHGHTTSLDALWMGVPVVSLAGEARVSRGGLGILSNLGLPDLVAFSEDDYVRAVVALARDLPRFIELRATLRPRMEASVLMDAPRFTRGIEAAYRAMWRRWCGKTPR